MTKGKGRNPGASSLGKHIKRKVHQERSQLAARRHLGELEKHKDHVLRGKKRKAKLKRLLQLKRAAAQRNPDEFQIGMTKTIMDVATGRMKKRSQRTQPEERAFELKQTIGHNRRNVQYLESKAKADQHRLRNLMEEDVATCIIGTPPRNKHIVFVKDEEEFKRFSAQTHFDATDEMLQQHPAIRGRLSILQNTVLPESILLNGEAAQAMRSTNQCRKARREVQKKLLLAEDAVARASLLKEIKSRRDMKQYHGFDDLLDEDLLYLGNTGKDEMKEGFKDNVVNNDESDRTRLLRWRREQEKAEAKSTARRVKEVIERLERSRSLTALAKVIRKQNDGIKKQLTQRKDSCFKPFISRRAR